jgi:hypothetical protein
MQIKVLAPFYRTTPAWFCILFCWGTDCRIYSLEDTESPDVNKILLERHIDALRIEKQRRRNWKSKIKTLRTAFVCPAISVSTHAL